jgi:hypothetical protein
MRRSPASIGQSEKKILKARHYPAGWLTADECRCGGYLAAAMISTSTSTSGLINCVTICSMNAGLTSPRISPLDRHDALVPFEEGRLLAAAIPSARFIPLESRNHVLLEEEPAWPVFLSAVREFLGTARDLPNVFNGAG